MCAKFASLADRRSLGETFCGELFPAAELAGLFLAAELFLAGGLAGLSPAAGPAVELAPRPKTGFSPLTNQDLGGARKPVGPKPARRLASTTGLCPGLTSDMA